MIKLAVALDRVPQRIAFWTLQILLAFSGTTALAQATDSVEQAQASESDFEVMEATIADIHEAIESGDATCVEITQEYLERIEAYDETGPAINAVMTVNPNALTEAAELDATYAESGFAGPLHCVAVLVKDQVETSDMPTTYGSALFSEFTPERDATIVERMESAGAIVIGKSTMGEFASRYAGSGFGFCRNVYDLTRNPSGSSCGTGIGVAASMATVGIAEDTGGSTRGPAAVSSAVGLRPTLPLISRFGMMPASPSTDTLGPLTRTVADTAILLDVIAGYDPNDPVTAYSVGNMPETYTSALVEAGLAGMRIGVIREPMDSKTEPDSEDYAKVKAVVDQAIADLQELGATVIDPVTIPNLADLLSATRSSYETEAAVDAYLEQHSNSPVESFREMAVSNQVLISRQSGLLNSLNLTTEAPEHLAAMASREELRQVVLQVMADNDLDALVYATFDHQPTVIPEDVLTNPDAMETYGKGSNRWLSPATGFPALTVPAGFTVDQTPVGIEFLGRPFTEDMLIQIGYGYEQGTLHRQPPSATPPLTE
ncbi:MAG: amidase [Elainellaceae cyanobacterium]